MPEYHNIQWFLPLEQYDFSTTQPWFRQVLIQLGLFNQPMAHWLTHCVWQVSDNGMAYFDTAPEVRLCSGTTNITICPLILGWTPAIYPALDHTWVEYQFLLASDDLRDWSQPSGYRRGVLTDLWRVMEQCYAAFPPTSIFLTDEAQDGQPFEGRIEQKTELCWAFDQALIPTAMEGENGPPPSRLHGMQYKSYHRYMVYE